MLKALFALTTLSLSFSTFASLVVVKKEFKETLNLRIIRAVPDGFESYALSNANGREMILVCAQNRFFENNKTAFIEYRNFWNEPAGKFTIESNEVCKEMATFIEQAHDAVNEDRPFLITLNKKSMSVERIVYPNVDPMSDTGSIKDLLPHKEVLFNPRPTVKLD